MPSLRAAGLEQIIDNWICRWPDVPTGRRLAVNARFSPLAKTLTVRSCDPLAKKGKMGQ